MACQEQFYKPNCPGVSKEPESFQNSTNFLILNSNKNKNKKKSKPKTTKVSSTLIEDQINSTDNSNTNNSDNLTSINSMAISNINDSNIPILTSQLLAAEYALVNPNGSNNLSLMEPVRFDSNHSLNLEIPDFDTLLIKPDENSGKTQINN